MKFRKISPYCLNRREFKNDLDKKEKFKLYVYQAIPTFSVTLADNYMVVTHYLPNQANKDCPAFGIINFRFFKRWDALYQVYLQNLTKMIRPENEITQENYENICIVAKQKAEAENEM